MTSFRFLFMADCQLGAYATFSGMNEEDIANFDARGMSVEIVPKVEGSSGTPSATASPSTWRTPSTPSSS